MITENLLITRNYIRHSLWPALIPLISHFLIRKLIDLYCALKYEKHINCMKNHVLQQFDINKAGFLTQSGQTTQLNQYWMPYKGVM